MLSKFSKVQLELNILTNRSLFLFFLVLCSCSNLNHSVSLSARIKSEDKFIEIYFHNRSKENVAFPRFQLRSRVQENYVILTDDNYRISSDSLYIFLHTNDTLELGKDILVSHAPKTLLVTSKYNDYIVKSGKSIRQVIRLENPDMYRDIHFLYILYDDKIWFCELK